MQPTTGQRIYYPELDGLRFIAFLLVFIHNAPYDTSNEIWKLIRERSWIGVDLFFCISGFLITRLLIDEYEKYKTINIRNFYIRRILRIWPLYFFIVFIAAIYTIANRGLNISIIGQIIGLVTFTNNFFTSVLNFTIIAFSLHLWTISYEQQFYLIVPHLVQKLLGLACKKQILLGGVVFLTGSLVRIIFIFFNFSAFSIYELPFTHFEAMLGGIIIGVGFRNPYQNQKRQKLLLLGIASLLFTFVLPSKDITGWHLMLMYPLTGIGVTLIIYSIIHFNNKLLISLLGNKLIVYFGKISYGLYIYHIASMYLATYILIFLQSITLGNEIRPQNIFGLAFILTISMSAFSYRFIEMPFLKHKKRFTLISSRSV